MRSAEQCAVYIQSNMSYIFTLKSNNHVLSTDFTNPIQLDPNVEYGVALIGFHSYNSIPNIDVGANKFYCYDKIIAKEIEIELPTGSYEIQDIEKYIRHQVITGYKFLKTGNYDKYFSLRPNHNTLKCEIWSECFDINMKPRDSIATLLGFSEKRELKAGQLYESDLPVSIIKVRTIQVNCNISTGAYYNHKPAHTIYEFAVGVDPGFAIDEIPRNIVYLPIINKREIPNITLTLLDQDSNPINFRGETVIVRLELKKLNNGAGGV